MALPSLNVVQHNSEQHLTPFVATLLSGTPRCNEVAMGSKTVF